MHDANCRRLYDLSATGYTGWVTLLIGLAITVIGVAIAWQLRSSGFGRRWTLLAFGLLWILLEITSSIIPFFRLRRDVTNDHYEVVRGVIAEYHALEKRQTGHEYFVVNGHRFEFSDADMGPGYKLTRRTGGVLEKGMTVSVAYRGDTILLLDVCNER